MRRNRRDVRNVVQKRRQCVKAHQLVTRLSAIIAANTTKCRFSQKPDAQCCAKNVINPAVHAVGTLKSEKV